MESQKNVKRPIGAVGLLGELNRSLGLINHYLDQITNKKQLQFGTPLSVELRRLLLSGRGNHLLKTIEELSDVEVKFSVTERPPDKYKLVGIDEYMEDWLLYQMGKHIREKEL